MDTCNCSGGGEGGGGGRNVQIGHGGGDLVMEIISSLSLFQMLACLHLVNLILADRGSKTPRTYSISRLEAAGPPLPVVPPHLNLAPPPCCAPNRKSHFCQSPSRDDREIRISR